MTTPKLEIEVITDEILPQFKATALKAAKEMPINRTLEEMSEFIWEKLNEKHPNFQCVVQIVQRLPGYSWEDHLSLIYSSETSQLLCFSVGANLYLYVFALAGKTNEENPVNLKNTFESEK